MRTFFFAVILGLLAAVHSTPVDTVTQIPTEASDEVIRLAVMDGFLVEPIPSLTTESPRRNSTVQASQQPPSVSTQSDVMEGSGEESTTPVFSQLATLTQTVSHDQISTSTALPREIGHSSADLNQSDVTSDHSSVSDAADSDSKEGDEEKHGQFSPTTSSTTSSSNKDTKAATSTSTDASITPKAPVMFTRSEGSGWESESDKESDKESRLGMESPFLSDGGSGSGEESGMDFNTVITTTVKAIMEIQKVNVIQHNAQQPQVNKVIPPEPQNKGHSTPGWIIIVGFIVGLAALVLLCLAIATRDKWNGPRQVSSSNQQRELEMETFLHNDMPRENGKAAEYTVIPLDELPEKYSSH